MSLILAMLRPSLMSRATVIALLLMLASPAKAHEWVGWFNSGRTELSPRGYQTARDVAAYAQQFGARRVIVTGHMDTAEGREFSDELSRRRAQAMATELARLGVSPDLIEVRGRGAAQLARATPPHTDEALNRRVIVDVHRWSGVTHGKP